MSSHVECLKEIAALRRHITGLRYVLRIAARDIKGENVMGGCSACGSEKKGDHYEGCAVVLINKALRMKP